MNLVEILDRICIKAPLVSAEQQAVINELVEVLAQAQRGPHPYFLKGAVGSL